MTRLQVGRFARFTAGKPDHHRTWSESKETTRPGGKGGNSVPSHWTGGGHRTTPECRAERAAVRQSEGESKLLRKTRVAAAAAAFALAGTLLFGGAAMAGGHGGHDDYVGGAGAAGGDASSQCLIPIGVSLGALVGNGGDVSQCNAAGGAGGAGGAGADY